MQFSPSIRYVRIHILHAKDAETSVNDHIEVRGHGGGDCGGAYPLHHRYGRLLCSACLVSGSPSDSRIPSQSCRAQSPSRRHLCMHLILLPLTATPHRPNNHCTTTLLFTYILCVVPFDEKSRCRRFALSSNNDRQRIKYYYPTCQKETRIRCIIAGWHLGTMIQLNCAGLQNYLFRLG